MRNSKLQDSVNCTGHDMNVKEVILFEVGTNRPIARELLDLGPCIEGHHLRIRKDGIPDNYDHVPGKVLVVSKKFYDASFLKNGHTNRLAFPNYDPDKGYANGLVMKAIVR